MDNWLNLDRRMDNTERKRSFRFIVKRNSLCPYPALNASKIIFSACYLNFTGTAPDPFNALGHIIYPHSKGWNFRPVVGNNLP